MIAAVAISNICPSAVLRINFAESDYFIREGSMMLSSPITVTTTLTQNPFTVKLSSVTVDTAEGNGLGFFIDSSNIPPESRAAAGI